MTNETETNDHAKSTGSRPKFRAWLVQDTPEGEAHWTELSGLWPTKSGKGFKGNLTTPLAATEGRLVILPASFKPGKEG
jgi:hypothetical protein